MHHIIFANKTTSSFQFLFTNTHLLPSWWKKSAYKALWHLI